MSASDDPSQREEVRAASGADAGPSEQHPAAQQQPTQDRRRYTRVHRLPWEPNFDVSSDEEGGDASTLAPAADIRTCISVYGRRFTTFPPPGRLSLVLVGRLSPRSQAQVARYVASLDPIILRCLADPSACHPEAEPSLFDYAFELWRDIAVQEYRHKFPTAAFYAAAPADKRVPPGAVLKPLLPDPASDLLVERELLPLLSALEFVFRWDSLPLWGELRNNVDPAVQCAVAECCGLLRALIALTVSASPSPDLASWIPLTVAFICRVPLSPSSPLSDIQHFALFLSQVYSRALYCALIPGAEFRRDILMPCSRSRGLIQLLAPFQAPNRFDVSPLESKVLFDRLRLSQNEIRALSLRIFNPAMEGFRGPFRNVSVRHVAASILLAYETLLHTDLEDEWSRPPRKQMVPIPGDPTTVEYHPSLAPPGALLLATVGPAVPVDGRPFPSNWGMRLGNFVLLDGAMACVLDREECSARSDAFVTAREGFKLHSTRKVLDDLESFSQTDVLVREEGILRELRRRLWLHPSLPRLEDAPEEHQAPKPRPLPSLHPKAAPPTSTAEPIQARKPDGTPLVLVCMRAVDLDLDEPALVSIRTQAGNAKPLILAHRKFFVEVMVVETTTDQGEPTVAVRYQFYGVGDDGRPQVDAPLLGKGKEAKRRFLMALYEAQYSEELAEAVVGTEASVKIEKFFYVMVEDINGAEVPSVLLGFWGFQCLKKTHPEAAQMAERARKARQRGTIANGNGNASGNGTSAAPKLRATKTSASAGAGAGAREEEAAPASVYLVDPSWASKLAEIRQILRNLMSDPLYEPFHLQAHAEGLFESLQALWQEDDALQLPLTLGKGTLMDAIDYIKVNTKVTNLYKAVERAVTSYQTAKPSRVLQSVQELRQALDAAAAAVGEKRDGAAVLTGIRAVTANPSTGGGKRRRQPSSRRRQDWDDDEEEDEEVVDATEDSDFSVDEDESDEGQDRPGGFGSVRQPIAPAKPDMRAGPIVLPDRPPDLNVWIGLRSVSNSKGKLTNRDEVFSMEELVVPGMRFRCEVYLMAAGGLNNRIQIYHPEDDSPMISQAKGAQTALIRDLYRQVFGSRISKRVVDPTHARGFPFYFYTLQEDGTPKTVLHNMINGTRGGGRGREGAAGGGSGAGAASRRPVQQQPVGGSGAAEGLDTDEDEKPPVPAAKKQRVETGGAQPPAVRPPEAAVAAVGLEVEELPRVGPLEFAYDEAGTHLLQRAEHRMDGMPTFLLDPAAVSRENPGVMFIVVKDTEGRRLASYTPADYPLLRKRGQVRMVPRSTFTCSWSRKEGGDGKEDVLRRFKLDTDERGTAVMPALPSEIFTGGMTGRALLVQSRIYSPRTAGGEENPAEVQEAQLIVL